MWDELLQMVRVPEFKCYHCGGSTFRFLDKPKEPPTVECLSCGSSSQFDRRGPGRMIDPTPEQPKAPRRQSDGPMG
jgi:hypothetical protein